MTYDVFLFDGNKTCPRIWMCSLALWLNCCTIPKTGVSAEEGPHLWESSTKLYTICHYESSCGL